MLKRISGGTATLGITAIVLALLLTSCTQNSKKQDTVPIIDFSQKQNVNVSDMLELDFVKLETGENCLINRNIRQIESFDSKIFVLSGGESSSLFVFDRSGKFITPIGKMGSGPGEFIVITSFSIDRRRNIVSFTDVAQRKIINYSIDNYEFVSEHKTPDYAFICFEYLGDKIVWNNLQEHNDLAAWNFIVTDTNQKYVNRYVEKEFITGYHTGPLKNLYIYKDELYAYPAYQTVPIIYRLSENDAVPVCRLQFGKYKLPPKDYLEKISAGNVNFLVTLNQSGYIYNFSVFETEKTLCVHYLVSEARHIGICSKSNGKTYNYTMEEFQDMLKTGKMYEILGIVNDYVAVALQPFDLIEMKANGHKFPQKLQDLLNESNDDDNPILCLFKFKD
ncbi:MAG: 6-bladed beta-propeller [Prevotellaceae bacterium]|jgi:hypothetical protein|nr:6-bladed beta-propeller [Prevotellaceae bacterium]